MAELIMHCPRVRPIGGHQGPLYLGDLHDAVERAACKPQWHWHHRRHRKRHLGIDEHLVGVAVGNPSDDLELDRFGLQGAKPYTGIVGNVAHGMIPEWTLTYEDEDKGIYCHGWRFLLQRWLEKRWIELTPEIEALLGTQACLNLKPKRVK